MKTENLKNIHTAYQSGNHREMVGLIDKENQCVFWHLYLLFLNHNCNPPEEAYKEFAQTVIAYNRGKNSK